MRHLQRILKLCLGKHLAGIILLSLLSVLKDLAGVITLAYTTDQIVSDGNVIQGILFMAIAMLIGVPVAAYERYNIEKSKVLARKTLLTAFEKKILRVKLEALENTDLSEILMQYNSDTEKLLQWFDNSLPRTFNLFFYLIGALIYSFSQNWILTLSIAPAVVLLTPLLTKIVSKFGTVIRNERKVSDGIMKKITEIFFGAELIKTYSLETEIERRTYGYLQEKEEQDKKAEWYQGLSKALSLFISYIPGVLAGIVGGLFLLQGKITVGFLIAFIQMMMGRIAYAFPQISQYVANAKEAMIYGERVLVFLDLPEELAGENGSDTNVSDENAIVFSHVSFGYKDRELLLKDISFSVSKGESVSLVGRSGCGKSTILRLMMGFYAEEYEGSIRILGKEMKEWDPQTLRKVMAPVFQQNHVFSGTVRENLEMVGSLDGIQEAMGLSQEIMEQEAGQKGSMLSGGQKQRVAIARGLIKNAEIYLLDEPLANLDNITEDKIMRDIQDVLKQKTVVMVEHRLESASKLNRILFVEDGTVKEEGTHDELMKKNGLYYSLYVKQTSGNKGEKKHAF
ncbi:MAG: ABC transporter ATP-binding protein [Lachnospiraceae bacterium]|nr:ABC transporter ATP-binding protein [Lachnospiraceae bacterium]